MGLLDDIAADISGDDVFYSDFAIQARNGSLLGTPYPMVFDDEYVEIDTGQTVISGHSPQGWCRTSEAPAVGTVVYINSQAYEVREVQPNTDGETLVYMHVTAT